MMKKISTQTIFGAEKCQHFTLLSKIPLENFPQEIKRNENHIKKITQA